MTSRALSSRQDLGEDAVHPGPTGDSLGGRSGVAGEDENRETAPLQRGHGRGRLGPQHVRRGQKAEGAAAEREVDRGLPLGRERLRARTEGADVDAAGVHQRPVPEEDATVRRHRVDP